MILAEKIAFLRKQNEWSQEQLAERLAISRQSVSKWESGASIPDIDKILILSRLFEVSTDYLLLGEQKTDRFQKYFEGKTEKQTEYLRRLLETAAEGLELLQ